MVEVHKTVYAYSEPVTLCHNVLRLTPRLHDHQLCLSSGLTVQPAPSVTSRYVDYFGNPSTFFTVQDRHQQLTVTVTSEAEVRARPTPDPEGTPVWNRNGRS